MTGLYPGLDTGFARPYFPDVLLVNSYNYWSSLWLFHYRLYSLHLFSILVDQPDSFKIFLFSNSIPSPRAISVPGRS